jgi:hypothetical protein
LKRKGNKGDKVDNVIELDGENNNGLNIGWKNEFVEGNGKMIIIKEIRNLNN